MPMVDGGNVFDQLEAMLVDNVVDATDARERLIRQLVRDVAVPTFHALNSNKIRDTVLEASSEQEATAVIKDTFAGIGKGLALAVAAFTSISVPLSRPDTKEKRIEFLRHFVGEVMEASIKIAGFMKYIAEEGEPDPVVMARAPEWVVDAIEKVEKENGK